MSGLRRSWNSLFRRSWAPLTFPNEGFVSISADAKIEEETLPDYNASHFYPVRIGEILRDRYQTVGKLGFGYTSTVWLARDLRSVPFLFTTSADAHVADYQQVNVGMSLSNSTSSPSSSDHTRTLSSGPTSGLKMPLSTIPVALLSEHFWTLSKSKAREGHIVVLYIQRFGKVYST